MIGHGQILCLSGPANGGATPSTNFPFLRSCDINKTRRIFQHLSNIMKHFGVVRCFWCLFFILCLFSSATADEPPDFKRGVALRSERRDGEAIEAFKKVLAASPDHVEGLVHMGASYEDLGDLKAAERAYRTALERAPNHAAARRNLEQLLVARDILATSPGPRASQELLINKGLSALERNEFDAALATFRLARGFSPDDPRPLFYTALAWERRGDPHRARAAYQQAVDAFPGYIPLRVNFVVFLVESGDRKAASREALAAMEAIPGDPRVRYLARLLGEDLRSSSDSADAASIRGANRP